MGSRDFWEKSGKNPLKIFGRRRGDADVLFRDGVAERELCGVERPVMELKAFRKVSIKPGETVRVSFPVNADMLKFYGNDGWTLENGSFTAYVGAASDDIRTSAKFNVK